MRVKLLTKELETKLIEQSKLSESDKAEAWPLVKFFGGSSCTWLVTEYDESRGMFFGLCDLGMGEPELGYVDRMELESIRFKPFNLPVERDRFFKAKKSLIEYAKEARNAGMIIA